MKRKWILVFLLVTAFVLLSKMNRTVFGQDVSAQISTRDAYVGAPVVLQIRISNAGDYELPELPEIDGCDVESAGTPSQSSQITIINGRRSESRSVTVQYLFTPRRAGEFVIPPMKLVIDGVERKTTPYSFKATKSETGDLMFAAVEGGGGKVYVGQPLDLKLKIWVKPFEDRDAKVKLSEGQMWQLLSDNSSWGGFTDRMRELAKNNQRLGGKSVARENQDGDPQEYYLYEIDSTIYPKRPGKIDASDIQVTMNYPTELGRSRDPLDSFFEGGFGSPFRRRLTVTSARPIVVDAAVDATEVVPVPSEGRPGDYRGAVGRYQMVTEAPTTIVNAGDPILLKIGIVGDGPMELVQAPPLSEIKTLTDDFKTDDQQLAGYVQDDTKVFATTIRPRHAGITQIPPIPFSFFNPDSERFETVFSDPIPLTVNEGETLSLDSIVSNSNGRPRRNRSKESTEVNDGALIPLLNNDLSSFVLRSQTHVERRSRGWWYCVFVPPLVWLAVVLIRFGKPWLWISNFRSTSAKSISQIESASTSQEISKSVISLVGATVNSSSPIKSSQQTVGALRKSGMVAVANELESFFNRLHQDSEDLESQKVAAKDWISRLQTEFERSRRENIRARRSKRRIRHTGTALFLLAMCLPVSTRADDTTLSKAQMKSVLEDGNRAYQRAQAISKSDQADRAEMRELFELASAKYQLLIDLGVTNSSLFLNLGNAQLQQGNFGHAIANYHRAVRLEPGNQQAKTNLKFAQTKIKEPENAPERAGVQAWNQRFVTAVGQSKLRVVLAIASLLFWALMIVRSAGARFSAWRLAIVPLLILVLVGTSLVFASQQADGRLGIMVTNSAELRVGDGDEFDVLHELDSVEGVSVEVLARRGEWLEVSMASGKKGWLTSREVIEIK